MGPRATNLTATTAEIDGRPHTVFAGCNYLGLAQHPEPIAAARETTAVYGLSTSASRTTTGQTDIHAALEAELADFAHLPAALLVPDGYTANIAAAQAFAHLGVRAAAIDQRAHASLTDAARAAGLEIHRYNHRDPAHAADLLRLLPGRPAVFTDAVFTATGALAPLPDLLERLPADALVLADDCHGFGVLGSAEPGAIGAGTPTHLAVRDPRLVVTTTLAKAIGAAGGAVMGQPDLIDTARAHATAFICTTPIATPLAAASRVALRLAGEGTHQPRLQANLATLDAALDALPLEVTRSPAPIRALHADDETTAALDAAFLDAHLLCPPSRYPGGPSATYFRLALSSAHTPNDLSRLIAALHAALGHPARA